MSKNMLIIMNPVAGVKKPNKCLSEILSLFSGNDYAVQIHMTTPHENGTAIVEKFAKDKDIIICIGGDGTFNEVVSGLVINKLNPIIGYIPSGSTNDFANGLGISKVPLVAAKDIIDGHPVTFDVGSFDGRVFIYTASFGIFTKASYSTPRDMKNMLGYFAYVLEGTKEIIGVPSYHIKVKSSEHEAEGDYIFGAICNARQIGGGLVKFSDSVIDMNDGKLEVLLVKYPKNPAEIMKIIFDARSGKFDSPMFDFFSDSEIVVTTEDDVSWTIDGEYQKGSKEIHIQNIQSAMNLILNKKENSKNGK